MEDGDVIVLAAGEEAVDIRLPEAPSTGYRWELADPPAGVLGVAASYDELGSSGRLGGTGIRTFRLTLGALADVELRFVRRRAWEEIIVEERRVRLRVST